MSILVIDDEENILRLVSYNLTLDGFEVILANNGEEGYKKAVLNKPQLILLDFMMPDMNGIQLCRKLRNNTATKNVIIVFMSAKGQKTDFQEAKAAGADDYITKPFDPEELAVVIKRNLEKVKVGSKIGKSN